MRSKTDIQKLLQLKRYEVPPSDFYENFLIEFRRRQQVDSFQRIPSFKQRFIERISCFLTSLRNPLLAYISIAIIGILLSIGIGAHFLRRAPKHSVTHSFHRSKSRAFYSYTLRPLEIQKHPNLGTFQHHFEDPPSLSY